MPSERIMMMLMLRFFLLFPDTYEIGMSHLGLRILYSILNTRDDVVCERTFMPWIDMYDRYDEFRDSFVFLGIPSSCPRF